MARVEGALREGAPPLGPPHPLGSGGLGPGIAWDSGRNGDLGDACSPPWGAERTVHQSGWAPSLLLLLQSSQKPLPLVP